jgi:hypothetical protein
MQVEGEIGVESEVKSEIGMEKVHYPLREEPYLLLCCRSTGR